MNILLTGAFSYTEEQILKLQQMGLEVDFLQYETDNITHYEKYDAVVCNGLFLHHKIEKFVNLKYIQLTSAGYDRIPLDYINKKQIEIHNAAGVYNIPIAEHTILKVMELYKKSDRFYQNKQEHLWEKEREIREIFGKTILIVGCGNIGCEIAKRFKAFGTTVIGVDINEIQCKDIDRYDSVNNLKKALPESDIVVLTLPLTEETKGIINKECFECMKSNSILVNVARGEVVNQEDMILALENKRIFGAVLDVFDEEPLNNNSKLWDLENVIVTPHNAFVGEGNAKRMYDVIYRNLKNYVKA